MANIELIGCANVAEEGNNTTLVIEESNPLNIPLILEKVIGFLSPKELRNCNSVSRSWRRAALRERLCRICVNLGPALNQVEEFYAGVKGTDSKVKVHTLQIYKLEPDLPILTKCFDYMSPYLSTLVLHIGTYVAPKDLGKFLKLLPNVYNLAILPLYNLQCQQATRSRSMDDPGDLDLFPILDEDSKPKQLLNVLRLEFFTKKTKIGYLSEALKTFPNLVEVSVLNMTPEKVKKFKVKDVNLQKLKSLRIVQEANQSVKELDKGLRMVTKLGKLGLRLRSLSVKLREPEPEPVDGVFLLEDLKELILSQKGTLEHLDLSQFGQFYQICHTRTFSPFPLKLPKLKVLSAQTSNVYYMEQLMKHFPRLEELRLRVTPDFEWEEILPSVIKGHGNLSVLRVDSIDMKMLVERILPSLPGLRVLNVNEIVGEVGELIATGLDDARFTRTGCEECGRSNLECGNASEGVVMIPKGRGTTGTLQEVDRRWKERLDLFIVGNCNHCEPMVVHFVEEEPVEMENMTRGMVERRKYEGRVFKDKRLHQDTPFVSQLWARGLDQVFLDFE